MAFLPKRVLKYPDLDVVVEGFTCTVSGQLRPRPLWLEGRNDCFFPSLSCHLDENLHQKAAFKPAGAFARSAGGVNGRTAKVGGIVGFKDSGGCSLPPVKGGRTDGRYQFRKSDQKLSRKIIKAGFWDGSR